MRFRVFSYFGIGILLITVTVGCQSKTFQSHLLEPPPELINFALLSKGATAEASQSVENHLPEEVIDGDTSSDTWDEGSGWGCSLEHLRTSDLNKRPYLQVNLVQRVDIRRIVMHTINSEEFPAAKYGLKDYRIEYWHGTGWEQILTGNMVDRQYTARDNTKGVRTHDIQGRLVAQKIRLVPVSSNDTHRQYQYMGGRRPVYEVEGIARVMELEVWGYPVATSQTAKKLAQAIALQVEQGEVEMEKTEKQKIKAVLTQYEAGYDTANLEQVMSAFSKTYSANGRMYDDIYAKASSFFNQYDQINMTLANITIRQNIIDDTAVVTCFYTLQYTPKENGKAQQNSGNISFVLVNEAEAWRIVSAN